MSEGRKRARCVVGASNSNKSTLANLNTGSPAGNFLWSCKRCKALQHAPQHERTPATHAIIHLCYLPQCLYAHMGLGMSVQTSSHIATQQCGCPDIAASFPAEHIGVRLLRHACK